MDSGWRIEVAGKQPSCPLTEKNSVGEWMTYCACWLTGNSTFITHINLWNIHQGALSYDGWKVTKHPEKHVTLLRVCIFLHGIFLMVSSNSNSKFVYGNSFDWDHNYHYISSTIMHKLSFCLVGEIALSCFWLSPFQIHKAPVEIVDQAFSTDIRMITDAHSKRWSRFYWNLSNKVRIRF